MNKHYFRILNSPRENPFDIMSENYHSLPACNTIEELVQAESSKFTVIKTPALVLDEFLKQKFNGIGLIEFMHMYTKKHLGTEFAQGVPPFVTCIFRTETDEIELAHNLKHHQSSIISMPDGTTHLNLHNNDVYKFTLINAKFDLEKYKNDFFTGYHVQTNDFHFFIKSSIQFDLTVTYYKLKS